MLVPAWIQNFCLQGKVMGEHRLTWFFNSTNPKLWCFAGLHTDSLLRVHQFIDSAGVLNTAAREMLTEEVSVEKEGRGGKSMKIICKKIVYFLEDWAYISQYCVCEGWAVVGLWGSRCVCPGTARSVCLFVLRVMWLWPPVSVLGGTAGLGVCIWIHVCTAISASFFP